MTLPQHFAANGYRTMTTGKVFHDAYPPPAGRKDGTEFTVWGYHGSFGPRPDKKIVPMPINVALMDWGVFPERDEAPGRLESRRLGHRTLARGR